MMKLPDDSHQVGSESAPFCNADDGSVAQVGGINITLGNIRRLDFVGKGGLEFTLLDGRVIELLSEDIQTVLKSLRVSHAPNGAENTAGETYIGYAPDKPSSTQGQTLPKGTVRVGGLTLVPSSYRCEWNGELVRLTALEFSLLLALASRPGDVKSRSQLIDEVRGYDYSVYDRAIDSHIKRVRQKFRAVDPEFAQIEAVYGVGYRYLTD